MIVKETQFDRKIMIRSTFKGRPSLGKMRMKQMERDIVDGK